MSEYVEHSVELVKRKFFQGDTPTIAEGAAFIAVFGTLAVIHFCSCILTHQWWWMVAWGLGLMMEIVGYSARVWYSLNDNNGNAYIIQLVFITVSPCFLMAGVYYLLAQLVLIYGNHYSYLKPMHYSLIFIICDVFSIFLQGAGGGVSAANESDPKTSKPEHTSWLPVWPSKFSPFLSSFSCGFRF